MAKLFLIIIILLLAIVFAYEPISYVVLLTTCVYAKNNSNDEIEERKELYSKQINRWINETHLPIFVVESSGYTFNEIPKNDRLHIFSFTIDDNLMTSSTKGEKISINYAIKQMERFNQYKKASHVLKVTGRYFLEGIENKLDDKFDLYLQLHRNDVINVQNSEYYGIRKELIIPFLNSINNKLMEHALYNFSLNTTWTTIGPFPNNVKRGGDKIIVNPL